MTWFTVALLAATLPVGTSTAQSVRVPHDYAIVGEPSVEEAERVLVRLRDHIIESIAAAGLTEAGFPRPCLIESHSDPERPGARTVDCVEPEADSTLRTGILFDGTGRFMQLSGLAELRATAYLAEVFLVPRYPYADFASLRQTGAPRVALHMPMIDESWHPAFWAALEKGLEAAGAHVVDAR